MRDYVLLTDSCCDLSAEMAAELGVEILPLSLEMGGKSYRNYPDGRDIGFQEFYTRLRAGELATTSAVNVGVSFNKVFAKLGKTPTEANKALTNAGLIMKVAGATSASGGSVTAISQSAEAGSQLPAGSVVTVHFGVRTTD